ncbi:DUF3945 domain-containing protein [Pedobacter alluvionis]|uniref:DUF3945 domain-containing protein n=1 Tax=Pedobacter alluvionis TaxID=475253 RepID=A0A497Y0G8_9SPHI|nr:DUF3945 domain-containing protein [Pedobacter alluvionis]RLJ75085.1 uncharacterized protein DUF3945 [Pedobacter alluvionis]TFB30194.1 DUF3945 domain-containing protein [Pedobacter alluvionis]
MSEEQNIQQESPDQLSDILLVLNKETMKLEAVKGVGKDGKLETVPPNKENENQFMRVDKNGDIFSNFFKNFLSQLKNPTKFSFFKVPSVSAVQKAADIKEAVEKPSPQGNKLLSEHEVKPDGKISQEQKEQNESLNQNTMENQQTATASEGGQSTGEYRYKAEDIDWKTMSNLGLSQEKMEKMKILEPLLKGYKTNELVPISLNLGTAITRLDARLSLQANEEGKVVVAIHGIRKEPNLNYSFFGHEFSKEDKANLLKTGNMGRIVELTHGKTGEKIPSIISVDRLTNELIALRADKIKVPDEIKGIVLNEHQKQTLLEGQPLQLKGMISSKGASFDASVQFNADKRYVEFLFDRTTDNRQTQNTSQVQNQPREAPAEFRGQRLTDEQYNQFKEGQTIHIDGLVDKKGKAYQGYITYNKETGNTDFAFKNPNEMKDQLQPTEAHKTQVAVNSDGKTNESTKQNNEPLKSGQANPDTAKEQQKQDTRNTPTKSKGRKI